MVSLALSIKLNDWVVQLLHPLQSLSNWRHAIHLQILKKSFLEYLCVCIHGDHVYQKRKFQPFLVKNTYFSSFSRLKRMFFQPVVQKLNRLPALLKVDMSRNLEYSYIIRVRIVGNVGNKIIPLHISKAYLKALAKALWYMQSVARESSQNQNARNTFIKNKTYYQICKKRLVIQSRSIARVWNTYFIIFSFHAWGSFPEGIFWRQLAIHSPEYHNIMGTKCEH